MFQIHTSSVYGASSPTFYDTTYFEAGKIWYGSEEKSVKISFEGGESCEFVINKEGVIESEQYSGEFETKKKVKVSRYVQWPAGHGQTDYIGNKK